MRILEKQRQITQRNYIDDLWQENDDVQLYSPHDLKEKHKYLVNATLESNRGSAKCAVLSKVRTHSAFGHYSYEPTIVVGLRTIKKEYRLEIFFVSYVLELVQGKRPITGRIVGLDGKSHRVKLENGPKILIPFLEPLQEWVAEDAHEPPSLILNKHCSICQFHDLCREKAVQEDNLSLLDGISTQKAINQYEKKGLFTVKQLSYTFRPRKRRKRTKNPPPVIHKPELQALAIREQKIYLGELPELTRQPVELFLDIEGVPDQQFYYLIGLLVCENETTTYHPFWADTPADEAQIWGQFLDKINQYPDAPIYHYGNYDARALTKMGQRYNTEVKDLSNRLVNVNKHIYGKVYFPIYSNRLKEIGAFIGATWTAPNVSGLQSLVWRYRWEETRGIENKALLLTYNEEDCLAVKLVTNKLLKIKLSADTLSAVDYVDQPKHRATLVADELFRQFETVLRFAHFKYDKNKIVFRKVNGKKNNDLEKKPRGIKTRYKGQRKKEPKPTRKIQIELSESCPKCGYKPIRPTEKSTKRIIIDLVKTKNGIRKTITEYKGLLVYCPKCQKRFSPSQISNIRHTQLYGHGLKVWLVYHRVAMRLSYNCLSELLDEQFGEKVLPGSIAIFVGNISNFYAKTEENIINQLLKRSCIHADETRMNIKGENWYAWVFTDSKYVFFKLTKTRKTNFINAFLAKFNGILISDFYPGYDALPFKQQKCWVHLIRDINHDLLNCSYAFSIESD